MPVEISGKTYWTVAERLTLAHGDEAIKPVGLQAIETHLEVAGGIAVVHARVTFKDGRVFTGMSMVNADSRSPAERNAPLETCETSAIGRALAFAGYFGSPEGIAGAEELHLAQERSAARQATGGNGSGAAPRPVRYADESGPYTRVGAAPLGPPPPTSSRMGGAGRATERQIGYAERLLKERGMPPPDDLTNMSSQDISSLIDSLRQS